MLMSNILVSKNLGFKIYCLWSTIAILFAITVSQNKSESMTRMLVIIFLAIQFLFRNELGKLFLYIKNSQKRFIISGTILATFVEGFHMISTPVFLSLRVNFNMPFLKILQNYFIDLIFTIPAYIIIFSVIWYFINKYKYSLFEYIITFGLAQTLGDGGIFYFIISPFMIFFIPYPMTNYHAINIIPFLLVKDDLKHSSEKKLIRYIAIPAVITTYLICGSIIKYLGNKFGFN
jgi:hypothetical protein